MIITYVYYFVLFGTILSKNLTQSKKVTQGMFIDIAIAVLNIFLNFLLIPYLGIYGAAFATLLSFITSTVVYYIYSYKHTFFVPIDLRFMIFSLILSFFILTFLNVFLTLSFTYLIVIKLFLVSIILFGGYLYFRKHHSVIRMLFARSND
jgi:Na+-driven multidrug efflux pump